MRHARTAIPNGAGFSEQNIALVLQLIELCVDRVVVKFPTEKEPRMGKGKGPEEVKSNIAGIESGKMTTS
jgi:hypothetical protein